MNKLSPIIFLAVALCGTCVPALATDQELKCDAVQTLAVVSADVRLIISQVKDPTNRTCHFFVSMPPSDVAENALQTSGAYITQLWSGAEPQSFAKLLGASASDAMVDAIAQSGLEPNYTQAFATTLQAQQPNLADCAFASATKKETFNVWNDVVSCGKSQGGNSFIMEAKFNSVSVSLYFPIQ